MSGDEGLHVDVRPAESFRAYLNTKQQQPGITGCSVRWDWEIKYGRSKYTPNIAVQLVASLLCVCDAPSSSLCSKNAYFHVLSNLY